MKTTILVRGAKLESSASEVLTEVKVECGSKTVMQVVVIVE